jgi:hypothetical protein
MSGKRDETKTSGVDSESEMMATIIDRGTR